MLAFWSHFRDEHALPEDFTVHCSDCPAKFLHYGNTGCQVGGTKLEIFLPKDQHNQKKFLSEYVDFYSNFFPILYHPLQNSTTCFTISYAQTFSVNTVNLFIRIKKRLLTSIHQRNEKFLQLKKSHPKFWKVCIATNAIFVISPPPLKMDCLCIRDACTNSTKIMRL